MMSLHLYTFMAKTTYPDAADSNNNWWAK